MRNQKSRSRMLNLRTALTKKLMLKGKPKAFRIRCIMLILGKFNLLTTLFLYIYILNRLFL